MRMCNTYTYVHPRSGLKGGGASKLIPGPGAHRIPHDPLLINLAREVCVGELWDNCSHVWSDAEDSPKISSRENQENALGGVESREEFDVSWMHSPPMGCSVAAL